MLQPQDVFSAGGDSVASMFTLEVERWGERVG